MRNIKLSYEQVETLVHILVEERDSLNDYLLDGTYDNDSEEKELIVNDVNNIEEILRLLK